MMMVTIYALFFDDIRILFLPPSADFTCDLVTLACIVLYITELILGSVAIEGYFLSFFFWLDLLAALSMIPDVSFILTAITGGSGGGGGNTYQELAKTSRASKVTRVIRIIRLIRLIRIVKLYKQQKNFRKTRAKKIADAR